MSIYTLIDGTSADVFLDAKLCLAEQARARSVE